MHCVTFFKEVFRVAMFVLVLITAIAPQVAAADINVSVTLTPESGTVQDVFLLEVGLSGKNYNQVATPVFEKNSEFTVEVAGSATQHSILNGDYHSELTYSFRVYPAPNLKPGKYELPQGSFVVENSPVLLKRSVVTILPSGDGATDASSGVDFLQSTNNLTPYVGEQILYAVEISTSQTFADAVIEEQELPGFWRESFGDAKQKVESHGDSQKRTYTVYEALFPNKVGEITLPSRILSGKMRIASRRQSPRAWHPFDELLPGVGGGSFEFVPRRFSSPELTLNVKPLPPPPRPNLRYIPVGDVAMSLEVDRTSIKQGESIALTLKLSGNANLKPYEVSDLDEKNTELFRIYKDKPETTVRIQGTEVLFEKTFRLAVVPQKSGELQLPKIEVVYFNPKTEKYRILRTKELTLQVAPDEQSTQMSVVGAATQKPTQIAETSKEQIVAPLAEDLLPQHTGEHTLMHAQTQHGTLFLLGAILYPLFALGVLLFRSENSFVRRILTAGKKHSAAETARASIATLKSTDTSTTDKLVAILKAFIAEQFQVKTATLTPDELFSILAAHTPSMDLADEHRQLFHRLTRLQYAGSNGEITQEETALIIQNALNLIQVLEPALKKQKARVAQISKSALLLCLLLSCTLSTKAQAEDAKFYLEQATWHYDQGRFEEAITFYNKALDEGVENGHIHYNLANALYRNANFGEAIYHFRIALTLLPRDADIKANLELARKAAPGRISAESDNSLHLSKLLFLNSLLNESEFMILLSACSVIFWTFVLVFQTRGALSHPSVMLSFAIYLFVVLTFLFTRPGFDGTPRFAFSSESRMLTPAVVITNNAQVRSGNSETFQVTFLLSEGAEVLTKEQRGDWIEVLLPNDLRGWIKLSDILQVTL